MNLHFSQTTSATPEQFIAGLTDFGPGRSKLFGYSTDDYLKVLNQGPGYADVTEGSGGIWETNHYDWSNPNRIVLHTTDSNTWANSSNHTYTLTRQPDGLTNVDLVLMREGKNLKGKLLAIFLGSLGKGTLQKAFTRSVNAIEARNYGGTAGKNADVA